MRTSNGHVTRMLSQTCTIVVEDDPALRADLVDYLNLKGFQTFGAASARHLKELVTTRVPRLVLLDIGLPDQSGLILLPWLRQQFPQAGIVMLTSFGDAESRINSLDDGADAYLVKGASLEVIEATCRALLRRLPTTPDARVSAGASSPQAGLAQAELGLAWRLSVADCQLMSPDEQGLQLTLTAMPFMLQLMVEPGKTISRQAILTAMSRPATLNNLRNLDGSVARLRRKVEQELAQPLPVRASYGQGYVFTGSAHILR